MDSTTWYNLFVKNKDRLQGNGVPVEGSLKCGNFTSAVFLRGEMQLLL